VRTSRGTVVDVSQLMSCGLNCSVLNAVEVVNFNVASMLCEKITEELLAGLTSCLQSLVSVDLIIIIHINNALLRDSTKCCSVSLHSHSKILTFESEVMTETC